MSRRYLTFTARFAILLLFGMCLLPESHAADADDVVSQLKTLTKGHVYRGSRYAEGVVYDKETIVQVEFEASKGWLGITVDDADETAPVTVILPLLEMRIGAPNDGFISLSCSSPCIKTTRDEFAMAVKKLSAGRGAELKSAQQRNSIHFGCRVEQCAPMRKALVKLVAASRPR